MPDGTALDEPTRGRYQEALQAYYGYRIESYKHRQTVFAWQIVSSKVIFYVVLLIVFVGIYFAAIQFHVGLRRESRKEATEPAVTELDASVKGVKVSSPVLGVIILGLSLAFFYLYLIYVYPISEVF
jgi:heme/copper-type cytochrome/quinol oxidase subunit 2